MYILKYILILAENDINADLFNIKNKNTLKSLLNFIVLDLNIL